jgi:hypothetical protein
MNREVVVALGWLSFAVVAAILLRSFLIVWYAV